MKRQAEAELEEQLSDAELGMKELQKAAKVKNRILYNTNNY